MLAACGARKLARIKAKMLPVRLPVDFLTWFREAAKKEGMTVQDAAREALAAWAKKHHS